MKLIKISTLNLKIFVEEILVMVRKELSYITNIAYIKRVRYISSISKISTVFSNPFIIIHKNDK